MRPIIIASISLLLLLGASWGFSAYRHRAAADRYQSWQQTEQQRQDHVDALNQKFSNCPQEVKDRHRQAFVAYSRAHPGVGPDDSGMVNIINAAYKDGYDLMGDLASAADERRAKRDAILTQIDLARSMDDVDRAKSQATNWPPADVTEDEMRAAFERRAAPKRRTLLEKLEHAQSPAQVRVIGTEAKEFPPVDIRPQVEVWKQNYTASLRQRIERAETNSDFESLRDGAGPGESLPPDLQQALDRRLAATWPKRAAAVAADRLNTSKNASDIIGALHDGGNNCSFDYCRSGTNGDEAVVNFRISFNGTWSGNDYSTTGQWRFKKSGFVDFSVIRRNCSVYNGTARVEQELRSVTLRIINDVP